MRAVFFLLIGLLSMSMTAFAEDMGDSDIIKKETDVSVQDSLPVEDFDEDTNEEDTHNKEEVLEQTDVPDTPEQTDISEAPEISAEAGWKKINNHWYYYDADGRRASGWRRIYGAWYYLDGSNEDFPGIMLADQVKLINGQYYSFTSSGVMQTGWIKRPEGWYYANSEGAFASGWNQINGSWYYLDAGNISHPRLMVSDQVKQIGKARYCFNTSGAMRTGWIKRSEGWYYANRNGALINGWIKLGTVWYYLDGSNIDYPGLMLSNVTTTINGKPYTFLSSGAMKTGWEKKDGAWYYYDKESGQAVTKWKYIDGYWYYFDPNNDNKMMSGGWHLINNKYYYMNSGGNMAIRWKLIFGDYYYLGYDGAMRTGWQLIDGAWYYFYRQNDSHGGTYGAMAKNTTIDGYKLQADGRWLTPEQMRMYTHAQMYSSGTGWLILVDRAACKVGIFNGRAGAWSLNREWSCSPGKPSTPTVSGVFHVGSKGYYFDSGSARCYWYTQFYNDYLFHSVLYSKYTGGLQDGRLGMQLSHGCVRLEINNAKWIYDNIPSGTTVVVY